MSSLPITQEKDQPPILRFVKDAIEDRTQTLKNPDGRIAFKDIIYVFVRSVGDTKTEVKFIARDIRYKEVETFTEETRNVERVMDNVANGEKITVSEPITEKIRHVKLVPEEFSEWLEGLQDKVKNNLCPPHIYEYCRSRLEEFEKTGTLKIDGTPISGWNQITPSQQKAIIAANVLSVEHMAQANEETLQMVGMHARELKKRAQAYVKGSDNAEAAATITKQGHQLESQKQEISALTEKMNALLAMQEEAKTTKKRAAK